MFKRSMWLIGVVLALLLAFASGWLVSATGMATRVDPATLPELERRFVEQMRGAKLVGRFTLTGREDRAPAPDSYEIDSVEKVGDDRWRFNARIGEYGNNMTLPILVTMRWVDDTPIIMMTDVTIPSVGTFTSRVFFFGDLYAGTWQHGDRGGHLFGRIEKGASRE